jgi:hypothetical protein
MREPIVSVEDMMCDRRQRLMSGDERKRERERERERARAFRAGSQFFIGEISPKSEMFKKRKENEVIFEVFNRHK